MVRICAKGLVINKCGEREYISVAEFWIFIILTGQECIKYNIPYLFDNITRLNNLLINHLVDILLLVGEEYINAAILLNQVFVFQLSKSCFYTSLNFYSIFVNIRNHKTYKSIQVCLIVLDIFQHKENLQNINGKHTTLLMLWIQMLIIVCFADNTSMTMIKEVFHGIVKGW